MPRRRKYSDEFKLKVPEVVGDVIQFLGDNFVSGLQSFLDGFATGAGM